MHSEDQALLKAYIGEWRTFFEQCSFLPMPFSQVESNMNNNTNNNAPQMTSNKKHSKNDDIEVRKVIF